MPRYLIKFLILTTFLALFAGNFGAAAVFADESAPPATADDGTKPIKMPETFSVNKYLKTEDQASMVPGSTTVANEGGVVGFLIKAIDLFVKIIGAIALIVFILGALLTILSEGKEDRLEKGKSAMVYALIGLIITFMAFIIVSFVQSIFF
ncbi:hypothetical protein HZC21_01180 [Candidatus Peregrinibacteria bacterium]|nr:hypothetical protein [Candidatus Peregrinibacteria bacterium]